MTSRATCHFVPPYLIERLQPHYLATDRALRAQRESGPHPIPEAALGAPAWVVHTCHNGAALPGDVVRSAGQPPSGDAAVDEAANGIEATLDLYRSVYDRSSYDGAGASVSLSVHYQQGYDNAYWDGTQLVFGDGDGTVFDRFTKAIDVLGHELTHAVTERTAGLTYAGQSGALNESVSDCFGSCVKQRSLGQSAAEADWLIGAGLFLPGIQGRALRDMAHPGTAYDDPRLGKDPQVGHLSQYVDTTDDNGGVHTNSGIPNRAFYLAATAIGGDSWDGAGRIWYAALTSGIGPTTEFAAFAAATVAAAGEDADAVTNAWRTVGVTPAASSGAVAPEPVSAGTPSGAATVRVRRTGGFGGVSRSGAVDLSGDDHRALALRALVDRVDVAALPAAAGSHPDAFDYHFDLCGATCRLAEHQLTDDLRRIADLVLAGA